MFYFLKRLIVLETYYLCNTMWTKHLIPVEKDMNSNGGFGVLKNVYKNTNDLFGVIHRGAFWFPKKMAQNKVRKVMHISTGLIVVTSIYI